MHNFAENFLRFGVILRAASVDKSETALELDYLIGLAPTQQIKCCNTIHSFRGAQEFARYPFDGEPRRPDGPAPHLQAAKDGPFQRSVPLRCPLLTGCVLC